MKIRILGLLFSVGALGAMVGATALTGCEQPQIECTSARGPFAAKYYLVSGTGACSERAGEVVGLQSYNPSDGEGTCEQRGDDTVCDGAKPDFTKSSLALQAESLGNQVYAIEPDADPNHKLHSVGAFKSVEPDGDDFCHVPTTSLGQQSLPEVLGEGGGGGGGPLPVQEALDLQYQWSNVKLYVTASAPGTQFSADLTYVEDGCTAQYKVVALYPAVYCEKYEMEQALDEDGNPAVDPETGEPILEPTPTGQPEDKLCDGEPDYEPQYGIPYGSGINPDFPVVCDPVMLLCVPRETTAGQPPAIPVTDAEE